MLSDNEQIILAENIETDNEEIINGLEAAVKRVMPKATPVKTNAQKIAEYAKKELGASKRRLAVIERLSDLKDNTVIAGLLNGRMQIVDGALVAVANPAAQTTVKLIPSDSQIKVGQMSFANSKHDKHALIHGFALRLASGAGITANSDYSADLPASLLNAEITIKCDNRVLVNKMPVEKLVSRDAEDRPTNYIALEHPKWIIPNKDFSIEIELPAAIGGTDTNFIKAILDVSEIISF